METLPSGERQGRYLPLLEIIEDTNSSNLWYPLLKGRYDCDDNEMMMKQTISVIGVCHRLMCDGCFTQLLK